MCSCLLVLSLSLWALAVGAGAVIGPLKWIPANPSSPQNFSYRANVYDLEELAKARSRENWVTVLSYNKQMSQVALNCLYSMVTYGNASNYIINTLDSASLKECLALGLPCFDGRRFMAEHNEEDSLRNHDRQVKAKSFSKMGSRSYQQVVWASVRLVLALLQLGYHVHFTDADVVYMRDIHASYAYAFNRTNADAIFMSEVFTAGRYSNKINSGVYAVKSNRRTVSMFKKWAKGRTQPRNQIILNVLEDKAYRFCRTPQGCSRSKQKGVAAVHAHAPQFGKRQHCPVGDLDFPCSPRRLFVHFICSPGDTKLDRYEKYQLMLIDAWGQPRYRQHAFLPCKQRVAWQREDFWDAAPNDDDD